MDLALQESLTMINDTSLGSSHQYNRDKRDDEKKEVKNRRNEEKEVKRNERGGESEAVRDRKAQRAGQRLDQSCDQTRE